MRRNSVIVAAVAALTVGTAGGLAFARQVAAGENDAVADLAKAKITLVQAVAAAEAQTGGKASKAELESERGSTVFKVEVVGADGKVLDVQVDAADGKVLSSRQDVADRGGEREEND